MEKKFRIGAAYYPEVFDKEDVLKDIERMKAAKLNVVRIAEFAWSTMEKKEGEYDFSIFKYVLDKLYENDIDCILCTPSATLPKWMVDEHKEVFRTRSDGRKFTFGERCQACKSNEYLRNRVRLVNEKMMESIGTHKAVIGFQIDNEINPAEFCYCDDCVNGFKKYLKDKYKTIENLNKEWGNKRWSLEYYSFDSVEPPRPGVWENPTLKIEWERFHSKVCSDFVLLQYETIKKYSDKPVGTDMMPTLIQNYHETNDNLDVVMFNHYEKANELWCPSFWFDFLRSLKEKDFIVTETMVNYNGSECSACEYRPKGTCYVNTMMPFIKGANMNMYWHFREHYCGHEIAHGAVYTTAGRLTYNADEIMKTYDALDKIKDVLFAERQKSDIALHFSTTSFLTFKYEKMFDSNNYIWNTMNNYHTALRHYNTDVIDTESDLSKYKVVVSPLLCNCTEYNFKERVTKFINDGGTWIVGPMSDIFTDFGARFIDKPHSFLEELGGVYLDKVIPFETEEVKAKYVENKEYIKACAPYYSYKPLDGSKSIVEYENDYLNGSSMIIERKVGKGKIIIVGAQIGKDVLLNLVGLKPILEASSNIELVKRNDVIYCVEMENEVGKVQLDKEYEDLLTGKKYKGEVVVDKHNILALKECK